MKASWVHLSGLLVAASLLAGCADGSSKSSAPASASSVVAATAAPNAAAGQVVVYYFHGARRCSTCMGIQAAIEKTIRERFATEVAASLVTFRELDMDEPANAHFVKEFDLSSSSMVVVASKGAATLKWENCEKVWELATDEPALTAYAEKQIRSYLELLKSS